MAGILFLTSSLLSPQRHPVPQLCGLFCAAGAGGGPAGHVQGLPALLDENGPLESHILVHVRKSTPARGHRDVLAAAEDSSVGGKFRVKCVILF